MKLQDLKPGREQPLSARLKPDVENACLHLPPTVYTTSHSWIVLLILSIAWHDHRSEMDPIRHRIDLLYSSIRSIPILALSVKRQSRKRLSYDSAVHSARRSIKVNENWQKQSEIYHRSVREERGDGRRAKNFRSDACLPRPEMNPTSVSISWKFLKGGGGVVWITDVNAPNIIADSHSLVNELIIDLINIFITDFLIPGFGQKN